MICLHICINSLLLSRVVRQLEQFKMFRVKFQSANPKLEAEREKNQMMRVQSSHMEAHLQWRSKILGLILTLGCSTRLLCLQQAMCFERRNIKFRLPKTVGRPIPHVTFSTGFHIFNDISELYEIRNEPVTQISSAHALLAAFVAYVYRRSGVTNVSDAVNTIVPLALI